MVFQSYLDVDMEETFDFFGHALLDYVRLIFMQAFEDNPGMKTSLRAVFVRFLNFYSNQGILANFAADALQDMGGTDAIDFRNNESTHQSIFATSANPVNDDKSMFDIMYDMTKSAKYDIRYAQRSYGQFDIKLPPAFEASQARKILAGEVIRSGQLLILASQELEEIFEKQNNNTDTMKFVQNLRFGMKHYLKLVKSMESNIQSLHDTEQLVYGENSITYAEDQRKSCLRLKNGAQDAWTSIVLYWLTEMGLLDGSFYADLKVLDEKTIPMFLDYRTKTTPLKTYYCTQNYLLYWTHIVLTHYTANDAQWKDMDNYCKKFNNAREVHKNAGTKRDIKRHAAAELSEEIMSFFAAEGSRKAWWDKNRVLRQMGNLRYIYSQDESPENHRYDRPADPEGIELYDRPGAPGFDGILPGVRGPMLRQENAAEKAERIKEAEERKKRLKEEREAKAQLFKLPFHDRRQAASTNNGRQPNGKAAPKGTPKGTHKGTPKGTPKQPNKANTRGQRKDNIPIEKPRAAATSGAASRKDKERDAANMMGFGNDTAQSNPEKLHDTAESFSADRDHKISEIRRFTDSVFTSQTIDFERWVAFTNEYEVLLDEWTRLSSESWFMINSSYADRVLRDYKQKFKIDDDNAQELLGRVVEMLHEAREEIRAKEEQDAAQLLETTTESTPQDTGSRKERIVKNNASNAQAARKSAVQHLTKGEIKTLHNSLDLHSSDCNGKMLEIQHLLKEGQDLQKRQEIDKTQYEHLSNEYEVLHGDWSDLCLESSRLAKASFSDVEARNYIAHFKTNEDNVEKLFTLIKKILKEAEPK